MTGAGKQHNPLLFLLAPLRGLLGKGNNGCLFFPVVNDWAREKLINLVPRLRLGTQ
jgi:hypothetical protein